jgi:hypothetical protein
MKYFGAVIFGVLTALSALGVWYFAHGAGTGDPHAAVFGLAISPALFLVFVMPFALLFLVCLVRAFRR